jgi:hypothetical protein
MTGFFRGLSLFTSGALLLASAGLRAERAASPNLQNAASAPPRASYALTVTRDIDTYISLETDGARLSDVAADLSKRLGLPIVVSSALSGELLRANFFQLRFETALSLLARRAFVDYEVRPSGAVPLQVYLLASGDPPVARGSVTGIMIEGHTEDAPGRGGPDPLRMSFEFGRLTIVADRQPLAIVARAIAEMLNVPCDLEYAATEIVSTTLLSMTPESALLRLSPNIIVQVRADLDRGERTVQRIRLVSR